MAKQSLMAASVLAASAAASLVSTGASVTLNNAYYFVSPFAQGKARQEPYNTSGFAGSSHYVPITVVAHHEPDLPGLFANWTRLDDVWQPDFLDMVLLAGLDAAPNSPASGADSPRTTILPLENRDLPSGPYFLDKLTGELHQAFRLYEDFSGSFIQSLLQGPDGRFQPLSAQMPASAALTIGVPSRLYFTRTEEKPLAGVRVGIKDIFDLAGVKKSNGNRAWYALYPPAEETAPAMQNLLDAGAIFVGVQKTSQFANGETPTADFVDYHAAFNPRGDGYQDTKSSSTGAAASIASYEWLDLAVGSDTGDSIRKPASVQGIFGNRPSRGLVSLDKVTPLSSHLDTPGLLARDPELWDVGNAALFRGNYTAFGLQRPRYPVTLRTLDLPKGNGSLALMVNKFAADLAGYLNTTANPLELHKEWNHSAPAEAKGHTISEMLHITYATLIGKEQTKLVREPFYKDYAAAHEGRLPFLNPGPLVRWSWADKQPQSTLDDAVRNKTLFMDWFNDKILPPSPDPLTCSSSLILYTQSTGKLSSRDRHHGPPKPPHGFSIPDISSFSEAPDSTFPIGEIPTFSHITNHTEYFPVSVGVIAAKGCDGLLAKLARDLVEAGILPLPRAGSRLIGGEVLMRREMAVQMTE